jgi:DNA-binding NarL/FixJ family response regulator
MQSAFSLPIITYSSVSELERQPRFSPDLVILSLIEASNEASIGSLEVLSELLPGVPVLVLVSANDVDLSRTAIRHSAKGCIPLNLGFEIAVEAVRFVLAQALPKRVARSQQVAAEDQPNAA